MSMVIRWGFPLQKLFFAIMRVELAKELAELALKLSRKTQYGQSTPSQKTAITSL
nr:MAG TPA: hypothetical protein [Caudoviricetes sp.]